MKYSEVSSFFIWAGVIQATALQEAVRHRDIGVITFLVLAAVPVGWLAFKMHKEEFGKPKIK